MTRTSRPAASASSAKPRSPSGLRCESGRADPAGVAGSAFVTVLMSLTSAEVIWLSCATAAESMAGGQRREVRAG